MLTNITPDHLNRYDYDFEKYAAAKFRITENQTAEDYLIYNADDDVISKYWQHREVKANTYPFSIKQQLEKGAYTLADLVVLNGEKRNVPLTKVSELSLRGKHNLYNSMAAALAASLLDIDIEIIRQGLGDFNSLEHRLETVAEIDEVEYINDSKATNIDSTWYALDAMNKPVVWIAGGTDKGNDYEVLMKLVKDKVKAIVCLGLDNEKIKKAFQEVVNPIVETLSASEAVRRASSLAKKGDVVLLSPACASFDLFKNYIDRGNQFKEAIHKLKINHKANGNKNNLETVA